MAPNKTLVFSKIPVGQPKVGEDLTYETREINLDEVPAGGLIVKIESVSLDPYMRGRMRDASIKSYSPAYTLGAPVDALALGKVVKSASPDYAEGDLVRGRFDIAEYTAFPGEHFEQRNVEKISNPHNLDLELFLGPLGMPGLTAWSSLFEIGKPKKGDTIFISSAAGAVGQTVAQIAKHEGLRVLGSVGSKDKLDYIINELGFDDGFDYKVEKPVEALARIAPEGIDIYFDNVGGEQLSAAITHMKEWGRIIACGAVSVLRNHTQDCHSYNLLTEFDF